MRLLITGGAGFIGSHVAETALSRGWTVAVLVWRAFGGREGAA